MNIYLQLNNKNVDSYLEFPLENSGFSLIKNFSTVNKYYYLYKTNDKFYNVVKSLFFFINHRGKSPNCTFKFGTYKQKPIKYENKLILLN